MEEESFEDIETARYINANYIAIKVDREERPDVDSIYMSAVRAMGQSGGWPLNVWLTPDRKPFFGGTYFPKEDSHSQPGFVSVLKKLKESFDKNRDKIAEDAQKLVRSIEQMSKPPAGVAEIPGDEVLRLAGERYVQGFDDVHGGLKARRNKFPSSLPVRLLFRLHRRTENPTFLQMAILTLDKMAAGGIYDQVGGGFHRYSVDPRWLVPHFEKMLYDNALLASAYLEAYQLTREERHAQVARQVLAYIAREMKTKEGAFFSATDADSLGPKGEREEGYYFTWTSEEITEVLGERAPMVIDHYGVTKYGNFEGRTILHVRRPLPEVAAQHGMTLAEAEEALKEAREALYAARQKRSPPHTDEKVLVAWNALMISAFAQASRVLPATDELNYREIAINAASFILDKMRAEGRLLRSYQGGKAHLKGYVDDYAFFIAALLDLYMATDDLRWMDQAIALQAQLDEHYADEVGGYFMTADDHEKLLTREKPASDGAIPSGNSYAILNLLRLYQFTGKREYLERADLGLRAFGQALNKSPTSLSEMLLAIDFRSDAVKQIVLVGLPGSDAGAFRNALAETYVPNQVFVFTTEGAALEEVNKRVPLVDSKVAIEGKVTAYVCEDTRCELPTNKVERFRKQIAKVNKPLSDKTKQEQEK
jgi:uncharacterized protein YyaL (SSP411 family)